jgi:hypothetical protein
MDFEDTMSPQPLSRVKPTCLFSFYPEALNNHPELVPMIMDTINLWSRTEYEWASVLVGLLHADPATGIAMYQKVASSDSRRQMVLAAAAVGLSQLDSIFVQATMAAIKEARETRNSFAHYIWGESNDLPDALLLVDAKQLTGCDVQIAQQVREAFKGAGGIITPPEIDMSQVMVWKKPDFQRAVRDGREALRLVYEIRTGLLGPVPLELDAPTRQRLLENPLVRQRVEVLCRESGIEVPT